MRTRCESDRPKQRWNDRLAGRLWVSTLMIAAAAQAGDFQYTVEVLEQPEDAFSVIPWGINNAGDVVGWVLATGQPVQACRWPAGQTHMVILPTPPGQTGFYAREITDGGSIAGGYEFGHAWTYSMGEYNILEAIPGTGSAEAWGINEFGDAVGTADPSALLSFQAFYYDAAMDAMVQMAPWPSRGYDVNDAGQATG